MKSIPGKDGYPGSLAVNSRFLIAISSPLLFITLLSGCASNLPREITTADAKAPALEAVHGAPSEFTGQSVRWGGKIVSVDNQSEETRIEIVEKLLHRSGRPYDNAGSGGRFIAVIEGFLDPTLYEEDRLLTVFGAIDGVATASIGEYQYTYPLVRVSSHHLWQPIRRRGYPGYWNDPWYRPWYGPRYDPWRRYWRRPGYRSYHDPWFPRLHRHRSRAIRRLL